MALKRLQMFCLSTALLVILVTGQTLAEGLTGTLDTVMDGDLITILIRGKEVEVRLFGIDAPEKTQPFGQNAKNFIGRMASDKEIRVQSMRKDANGRTVALVYVNGVNLNEQMVGQGLAWVLRQECVTERFCADWVQLEATAKGAHKGLWAGTNPTPPWEHRKNQLASSAGKGLELAASPLVAAKTAPAGSAAYHGDTAGRVFHSASCKDFHCPKCTVNFQNVMEALDAGYRPHRDCIGK